MFRERQKLVTKIHFVSAVFIALAIVSLDSLQAQTYRIMPVGDSITAGYYDNPTWSHVYDSGYRGDLYDKLTANGIGVNYVGTSGEPRNGAFPINNPIVLSPSPNLITLGQDKHEGYGGKKTDFISTSMAGFLATNNPDVILLMIGINDFSRGASLSSAQASLNAAMINLNATVRTVVTNKPNAKLIIAETIPPMAPSTALNTTPGIGVYNDFIRNRLVPSYAAQGYFVSSVDQYSNFLNASKTAIDASLYANAINHPNAAGYAKMANTWYDGIRSINLNATISQSQAVANAANLVENGNFDASSFSANSHNINPANTGWTYTSGASGAGSGIDRGNPFGTGSGSAAAEGAQMAFLQSSGNGSVTTLSQLIDGFTVGHEYQLTFQAKGITTFGGANPFSVKMSGNSSVIPLFDGNLITPVTSYLPYSSTFIATDSDMTLSFFDAGLSVSNKVTWIDSITIVDITVIPEPSSIFLVGVAMGVTTMIAKRNSLVRSRVDR